MVNSRELAEHLRLLCRGEGLRQQAPLLHKEFSEFSGMNTTEVIDLISNTLRSAIHEAFDSRNLKLFEIALNPSGRHPGESLEARRLRISVEVSGIVFRTVIRNEVKGAEQFSKILAPRIERTI